MDVAQEGVNQGNLDVELCCEIVIHVYNRLIHVCVMLIFYFPMMNGYL
jgi:hypothetical protein